MKIMLIAPKHIIQTPQHECEATLDQIHFESLDIRYPLLVHVRNCIPTWRQDTITLVQYLNTLRPKQNGRRFADDTFKRIFLNENVRISIKISLKFVPKGPINNIPALVQIMAWCRSGDKPLSEPMMVSLLTHICVTRPQWVNEQAYRLQESAKWNLHIILLHDDR